MGRGGRSESSRAKLYKRWGGERDIEKVKEARKKDLYIHKIRGFPSNFLAIKQSGKTVRKIVKKKYSATSMPQQLQTLPSKGKILLPLDHLPLAQSPEAIKAMDDLLFLIQTTLAPKIAT
ncbi:hypothetical protein CY34DRAFT_19990, partial [Suillus luteus UH-Slu-Lm8-n1]